MSSGLGEILGEVRDRREAVAFALFCFAAFLVLALMPVWMPAIIRYQDLGDTPACLGRMVRIVEGAEPSSLACPVSGAPYRLDHAGGVSVLACPSGEPHMWGRPRFVRDEARWRFVFNLPADTHPSGADPLRVADRDDALVVTVPREGILGLVFVVIVCMAVPGGLYFYGLGSIDEFVLWLSRLLDSGDRVVALSRLVTRASMVLFAWAIPTIFIVMTLPWAAPSLRERRLTIAKDEHTLTVEDRYPLGIVRSRTLRNVELFYPVVTEVNVFYREGSELGAEALFKFTASDLTFVPRMNDALARR